MIKKTKHTKKVSKPKSKPKGRTVSDRDDTCKRSTKGSHYA